MDGMLPSRPGCGTAAVLNGLISMIVMAKLHFPPIAFICSLEHERAK
jgi:hypothetical protein